MRTRVIHEVCREFFETHGKACETCSDAPRCNQAGFKPLEIEVDKDLAVIIDFAEGEGYEIRAVGGTAGHFVLT